MQHAYVLHRRQYRESSLIVEFLTREQGRIAAVARGAMRSRSRLAGVLQPRIPLLIETRGRGELLTLTRAEPGAAVAPLEGERLYSLFYVNELIMRLTGTHDPAPELFAAYAGVLAGLDDDQPLEPLLRHFECALLADCGLAMNLVCEADSGAELEAGQEYFYVVDHGAVRDADARQPRVQGATLLALAGAVAWTPDTLRQAKQLMRTVLDHHLDGRPLASRELFGASRPRSS